MATANVTDTSIEDIDLDAMLADLDIDEAVSEPVAEEPKKEAAKSVEDELDDILGELDELDLEPAPAKEAKKPAKAKAKPAPKKDNSDLYAEDEVAPVNKDAAPETKTEEVAENKKKAAKKKDEGEEPAPKKEAKKPAKKAGEKKETKPRAEKVDPSLPASEQLTTRLGESGTFLLELEDGVKLDAAVVDAMPKKVKEKLLNLYAHLHSGAKLSTYTERGLAVVVKAGEGTNATIQADFETSWSKGTAASQAGQIVRLLKDLKICNADGKTLTPNKNSKLLPLLTAEKTEETEA